MPAKGNKKQTLAVLLLSMLLITLCSGGLWAYVKNADAETGVQEAAATVLPEEDKINFTMEKYDNYPVASDDGIYGWQNGKPLKEAEIQRISELVKAYAEGLRPKNNAPSLPVESDFAIVPLDPNEFAGMTEFYLLPNMDLTDQQLLMLIEYGEKIGVPFTEDALTPKNCTRWFNTYSNRYLSAGESARRDHLLNRIMMEGLRPASPELTLQKLPISGVGSIRINQDVSSVLDTFQFYPIREMTDEELLQTLYLNYIDSYTYLNPAQEKGLNPAEDEANMRLLLEEMMGMPMSAESTCISYKQRDATGEVRMHAVFKSALINGKETEYSVIAQMSSGNILYALQLTSNLVNPYTPGAADPPLPNVNLNDRRWTDIATKVVSKLTSEETANASATDAGALGDDRDAVVSVDIIMKDGGSYVVHIRVSDGMFMSAQYLSDDLDPINYNMW